MKNSKDGTSHVLLPALRSVYKPTPHRLVTLASASLSTRPGPFRKWGPVAGPLWVTTRQGSTQHHRTPSTQWTALRTPVSMGRPERACASPWLPSRFQWNLLERKGSSLPAPWSPWTHGCASVDVAPRRRSHEEERRSSVSADRSDQRSSAWLFQFLEAVTRWEREARALGMTRRERWGLLRHYVHDMRQHVDDEHLNEWTWAQKADTQSIGEVKRLFHAFLNALPDGFSIATEKDTQLEMEKIALRFLDCVVWLSVLSSRNLNVPAFVIGMNIWHEVCVFYSLFVTHLIEKVDLAAAKGGGEEQENQKHGLCCLSLMSPAAIGKRYAPNSAIRERWLHDVQLLQDNCVHALTLPAPNAAAHTLEEARAMQDVRHALSSLRAPSPRVRLPLRTGANAARSRQRAEVAKKTTLPVVTCAIADMTHSWSGHRLRSVIMEVLREKRQQQQDQMAKTEARPRFLFFCEEILRRCPKLKEKFQFVRDIVQQQQQAPHHTETRASFEVLLSLAIERRAPLLVELAVVSLLLHLRLKPEDVNHHLQLDTAVVAPLVERAAELLQDPSLEDWNCLLAELLADKVSSKFGGRTRQAQLIATFLCTAGATRPLYAMMGKTASYDPLVLLKFTGELLQQGAITKLPGAAATRLMLYTVTVLLEDVLDKVPARTPAREYDQEVLRVLFGGLLPACGAAFFKAPANTAEEAAVVRLYFDQCLELVAQLGLRWDFMVAPERRQHRQAQRDPDSARRRLRDGIRSMEKLEQQRQPRWSVHGDNDYPFFLSITPGKTVQLAQLVDSLLTHMSSGQSHRCVNVFIPFMSAVHIVIREVDAATGRRWENQIARVTNQILTRTDVDATTAVLVVLRSLSSLRFGGAQPVTVYSSLCRAAMWHTAAAPESKREEPKPNALRDALTHTLRCIARNTNSSYSERVQEMLRVVARASAADVDTTGMSTLEAMFQTLFYRRHTLNGGTLKAPQPTTTTAAAHASSQPFTAPLWASPATWYRWVLSEEQWLPLLRDHFHVQRLVACALLAEDKVPEALTYIPSCDERVAVAALRSRSFTLTPRGTMEALLGRLAKLHVALYYCSMDRTASSATAAKQVAGSLLDAAPAELMQAWRVTWRAWCLQSQAPPPPPLLPGSEARDQNAISIRPYDGRQFLRAVDRVRQTEGELYFRFQPQSHVHTFEYDCCRQLAFANDHGQFGVGAGTNEKQHQ